MPRRIVLASGNQGKLRELRELLAGLDVALVPQSGFDLPEAVEDGLSFVENAIIKARHAAALTGLPAIADDSGLEVDALAGAPGIRSARYAGAGEDADQANNRKLLEKLRGVPEAERGARFQCAIALMRFAADPMPLICQGSWEGRILFAPAGSHGFGYDPLFLVPALGRASAELPPEEKNRISHRAQALRQLRERWPWQE